MYPLRALLIGAGKIGAQYAVDETKARYYPWASHAQVLTAHPGFVLDAVVDSNPAALRFAQEQWNIRLAFRRIADLPGSYRPDIVIVATPPESRAEVLQQCPAARGLMLEKPIALDAVGASDVANLASSKFEVVQVNLFRRGDALCRELASGKLQAAIGCPQAIFGIYGNGLINNGTHMIDLVRMLCGPVQSYGAIEGCSVCPAGPFAGDLNVHCRLQLECGCTALFGPVDFRHYRENAIDIWGERGRLSITQEGLLATLFPRRPNRALRETDEIASDCPAQLSSTIGEAMYNLYTNLHNAISGGEALWSPVESALETAHIVSGIMREAGRSVKQPC